MISARHSAFGLLLLAAMAAHASAQAQPDIANGGHAQRPATVLLAQNTLTPGVAPSNNNAIRRINPNSRQGTGPAPGLIRPGQTVPQWQRPSIENGQIGNGYPRNPPVPQTLQPTAPSVQPRDAR